MCSRDQTFRSENFRRRKSLPWKLFDVIRMFRPTDISPCDYSPYGFFALRINCSGMWIIFGTVIFCIFSRLMVALTRYFFTLLFFAARNLSRSELLITRILDDCFSNINLRVNSKERSTPHSKMGCQFLLTFKSIFFPEYTVLYVCEN